MVAIISTINLKGGVGKTTTAVALAEAFASEERRRVLVIDLDPQTNATVMLIGEDRWKEVNDEDQTLARLFKDGLEPDSKRFDVHKALQKDVGGTRRARSTGRNERGRVDLLPSSIDLIDVQDRLASIPPGRFYANQPIDLLRRAVESILSDYDNVLIDCPPNLGIITLNGLRISTGYIIPTIPDVLSTYGIPQIVSRVSAFSEEVGEEITPLGIIVTKFQANSTVHQNTLRRLREEKDAPMFRNIIRQTNQLAAAAEYKASKATFLQKYGYNTSAGSLLGLAREVLQSSVEEGV